MAWHTFFEMQWLQESLSGPEKYWDGVGHEHARTGTYDACTFSRTNSHCDGSDVHTDYAEDHNIVFFFTQF